VMVFGAGDGRVQDACWQYNGDDKAPEVHDQDDTTISRGEV
jgi:hypothetical protein